MAVYGHELAANSNTSPMPNFSLGPLNANHATGLNVVNNNTLLLNITVTYIILFHHLSGERGMLKDLVHAALLVAELK